MNPYYCTDDAASAAVKVCCSNQSATTSDPPDTAPPLLLWKGAWKFEASWFALQHPWIPSFVAKRALASMLVLHDDYYHQVDGNTGKALKEKRPLQIVRQTHDKAELVRLEGDKQVPFSLEKRTDGHVYYVESGLKTYRLEAGSKAAAAVAC
jgi:hypothetical protein